MKNISLSIILVMLLYCCETNAQSLTARYDLPRIIPVAKSIDSSALLISINSDSLLKDGTSLVWHYQYEDGIKNVNYFFHSTGDSVFYDSTNSNFSLALNYIWVKWIDSDSALIIAEEQGGKEFRNGNPHYRVEASLKQLSYGAPLFDPRWYVTYRSLDNPDSVLFMNIDAIDSNVTGIKGNNNILPNKLVLSQNYPNPFNPSTNIKFTILKSGNVKLYIYDLQGRKVKELIDKTLEAGDYTVNFNASTLSSGIYFYTFKTGSYSETKKMVLLK